MTDVPSTPPPGSQDQSLWGAPPPYQQQPPYGQPQPYGQQPHEAYGGTYQYDGPIGSVRPTGRCILLFVVTFGIYQFVYNYSVHDEMKRHTHRGVGGGIALLLSFLANVAMPFVTASEVGGLYGRKNQPEPVRGLTGLWSVLGVVAGYVVGIIGLVAGLAGSTTTTDSEGFDHTTGAHAAPIVVGILLAVVLAIGGGVVWFVKTNGALNRYWESLGATR